MEKVANHIRTLLEGTGPTIGYLATCDAALQVSSAFVLSFEIKENPLKVVAYIPEAALGKARQNLLVNDYASLLIVNALTYEGIQAKGHAILKTGNEAGEAFLKMNLQRLEAFYAADRFRTVRMHPLLAVELTVREIYNQTPGIGAGDKLDLEGREPKG